MQIAKIKVKQSAKINGETDTDENDKKQPAVSLNHSDDDGHDHGSAVSPSWLSHWPLLTALVILLTMQVLDFGFKISFLKTVKLIIYSIAYLLAGYNVLDMAWRKAKRFDFFNEFPHRAAHRPDQHAP